MASTILQISITHQRARASTESFLLSNSRNFIANPCWPRCPPPRLHNLTFYRCRRESAAPAPSVTFKKKKKSTPKTAGDEEDIDEDAFEALFLQLEEDLKNDELNGISSGADDIREEDLAKLEQELAEALDDDELLGELDFTLRGKTEDEDEEDEENDGEEDEHEVDDDNEEDDELPINLKNWQLRRLAFALKNGRRKTSIKNLAADLGLNRAVVLKLLRDPPPNLILLSATLPDKPTPAILNTIETVPLEPMAHAANPKVKEKVPVHVMQSNWCARKRLKKAQIETLEQVYRRTKRPTNTMIGSIVHITNLPRKKVVKWFEDKRAEEGVPEHHLPYQRSAQESVFTS